MKISNSKVRVEMPDYKLAARDTAKGVPASKPRTPKADPADALPPLNIPTLTGKPKKTDTLPVSPIRDDYSSLREAVISVERIKISARQELEQIKRMRAEAARYQQETATRARSQANQLILHARLATQREIEELIHQASEEIQKMLADIRVIRITAQEELAAQRKFTDAAKINSMAFSVKEQLSRTPAKPRKQLVGMK